MQPARRQTLKTASAANSIWRDVHEDDFRTHLVALEKASGNVPSDPRIHSVSVRQSEVPQQDAYERLLPFHVEQRLADDFAFVAAAKEDPKAVSATTVEEYTDGSGLTIRLAANDGVLPGVEDTLKAMLELLARCAERAIHRSSCEMALFGCVVGLCEERIHGRFESHHWKVPRHQGGRVKQPLHQALRKFSSSLEGGRSNAPRSILALRRELNDLCSQYQAIDRCSNNAKKRVQAVKAAIRKSYDVCTSNGTCSLESTIQAYGLPPNRVCQERTIRQVNKIGRYWGLCHDMAEDSRKYRNLFQNTRLECLKPFTRAKSRIYAKATSKGYVECLVHAEIQMTVYHDKQTDSNAFKPRIIGVSKAACYLCNLFIQNHAGYFVTKTHGHLYGLWTLPDREDFSSQQQNEYRRVVSAMRVEMMAAIKNIPKRHRGWPMGSWISLQTPPWTSPLSSDAGTIILNTGVHTFQPPDPVSTPPKASPQVSPQALLCSGLVQSRQVTPCPLPTPPIQSPESKSSRSLSMSTEDPVPSYPPSTSSAVASQTRHSHRSESQLQLQPGPASSISDFPSQLDPITTKNPNPERARTANEMSDSTLTSSLRSLSSTSIISLHPLNTPLTGNFNSARPLRWHFPGLYITFEHEGDGSGEVNASITETNESKAEVIYVDEMKPGEEISLHRGQNAAAITMSLHHKTQGVDGAALQLDMRWLSCENIALQA